MGEYLFPITVEGDSRPEHAKSVKNILQTYFQSKNSLRGDFVVQNLNQNAATILFKKGCCSDCFFVNFVKIAIFTFHDVPLKDL